MYDIIELQKMDKEELEGILNDMNVLHVLWKKQELIYAILEAQQEDKGDPKQAGSEAYMEQADRLYEQRRDDQIDKIIENDK